MVAISNNIVDLGNVTPNMGIVTETTRRSFGSAGPLSLMYGMTKPDNPQQHPLAGRRHIDFTHALAGLACSYYLGLLEAEVIKV